MKRDRAREEEQARMLWRLSAMGGELAFGIVGMVLLGLGIDYVFKTEPKGVVTCTILGVLGSGYNFIRHAVALNKRAAAASGMRKPTPKPEDDGAGTTREPESEEQDEGLRFPPDPPHPDEF